MRQSGIFPSHYQGKEKEKEGMNRGPFKLLVHENIISERGSEGKKDC